MLDLIVSLSSDVSFFISSFCLWNWFFCSSFCNCNWICFCDIRHHAHQLIFYLVFKKRIFSLTLFSDSSSSLRTFSIGKSASVKLPIVFTELDETPRAWNASLVSWMYMSNVAFGISELGEWETAFRKSRSWSIAKANDSASFPVVLITEVCNPLGGSLRSLTNK